MNKGGENIYDRVTFMLKFIYQHNHTDSIQNRIIRRCLFTIRLCPPRYNSGLTKTPPAQSTPLFKTATTVDSFERTHPKKETVSFKGDDEIKLSAAELLLLGVVNPLLPGVITSAIKTLSVMKDEQTAAKITEELTKPTSFNTSFLDRVKNIPNPDTFLEYTTTIDELKNPNVLQKHSRQMAEKLIEALKNDSTLNEKQIKRVDDVIRRLNAMETLAEYTVNSNDVHWLDKNGDFLVSDAFEKANFVCSPEVVNVMAKILSYPDQFKRIYHDKNDENLQACFMFMKHPEIAAPVLDKALENISEQLNNKPSKLIEKKLNLAQTYVESLNNANDALRLSYILSKEERTEMIDNLMENAEWFADQYNKFQSLPDHLKYEILHNPQAAFNSRTSKDLGNQLSLMFEIKPDDVNAQNALSEAFKFADDRGIHKISDNNIAQWRASLLERESGNALDQSGSKDNEINPLQIIFFAMKAANEIRKDDAKAFTKTRRVGSDAIITGTQIYTAPARASAHVATAVGAAKVGAAGGGALATVLGLASGPAGWVVLGGAALLGGGSLLITTKLDHDAFQFMEKTLKGEHFKEPYFSEQEKAALGDNFSRKKLRESTLEILSQTKRIDQVAEELGVREEVVHNFVNKYTFAILAHGIKKY